MQDALSADSFEHWSIAVAVLPGNVWNYATALPSRDNHHIFPVASKLVARRKWPELDRCCLRKLAAVSGRVLGVFEFRGVSFSSGHEAAIATYDATLATLAAALMHTHREGILGDVLRALGHSVKESPPTDVVDLLLPMANPSDLWPIAAEVAEPLLRGFMPTTLHTRIEIERAVAMEELGKQQKPTEDRESPKVRPDPAVNELPPFNRANKQITSSTTESDKEPPTDYKSAVAQSGVSMSATAVQQRNAVMSFLNERFGMTCAGVRDHWWQSDWPDFPKDSGKNAKSKAAEQVKIFIRRGASD